MVDARKYASKYIKPDNVRDGPIQTRILTVFEGERYGQLMLELETGSQFPLNDTNTNTLIKAWGHETDTWIRQEIILEFGTYKDWRTGEDKETVKVRAVSSGNGSAPASKPLPPSLVTTSLKDDLGGDDIPFVLAFVIASAVAWLAAGGTLIS